MIRRFLLSTTILLGAAGTAFSQEEADALRYSYLMPQGTARSIGFGGALGAIGGDFSSLSVNPAGIGVYRSSELSFTPSLKMNSSNSTYTGSAMDDDGTRFNINNFGAVFTAAAEGRRYKNSKWKAVSFGIGVNRMADFSGNYTYSGFNNSSSASEVFYTDLLQYPGDSLTTGTLAGLGYSSFLTNSYYDTAGVQQFYFLPDYQGGLNQSRSVKQRGGVSDINISLGGNYEEKLMIGATLGIPTLRYLREVTFREEDATGNPNNDFNYFEYKESLKTTGTGINLKLGFIYNFTKFFRAGAAIHTPTLWGMTDQQSRSVTSHTEGFKQYLGVGNNPITRVDAPVNEYNYTMITPWRGLLSAAGIIGKYGFISVDYEYVDYASARFSFEDIDSYYESEVNNGIKSMYKGASNLRIGGEARFDIFMVRLGFGYYGNPYKDKNMGSERLVYSAGAGIRFDNVFIDLGYSYGTSTFKEQPYAVVYQNPYEVVNVPNATVNMTQSNVALTLGVKF